MASSSHNGALVFGLVLGAAGGAAWAILNAAEPGEKLRSKTSAMVDAALGRNRSEDRQPDWKLEPALTETPPQIEGIAIDEPPAFDSASLAKFQ